MTTRKNPLYFLLINDTADDRSGGGQSVGLPPGIKIRQEQCVEAFFEEVGPRQLV